MASSQSSITSTPTSLASLVPPSSLGHAPQELTWNNARWLQVPHGTFNRRGHNDSLIWRWGHDFVKEANPEIHGWRCGLCIKDYLVILDGSSTSNARRHLKTKHHLNIDNILPPKRTIEEVEGERELLPPPQYRSLLQVINIDDFRFHLTRWIVERHIPFTVVEDENFQAMLSSLNSTVKDRLVKSGDSIRNWMEDEFVDAKIVIQNEVLGKAISKIHISCDIWSSPNGYAMCGIAAHFVGHQGKIQSVLLGLKRLMEAHSGEQIAQHIVEVVESYGFTYKLGVFVGDNAETNDVAWRETLRQLHPERDPVTSRSRCLGHIINLAAKAFLFGKNTEAFDAVTDLVNDSTPQESDIMKKAQAEWRKKGPIGKLHNIVIYIRASAQRREAFKRCVVDGCNNSKSESRYCECTGS